MTTEIGVGLKGGSGSARGYEGGIGGKSVERGEEKEYLTKGKDVSGKGKGGTKVAKREKLRKDREALNGDTSSKRCRGGRGGAVWKRKILQGGIPKLTVKIWGGLPDLGVRGRGESAPISEGEGGL